MDFKIVTIVTQIAAVIFAVSLHEASHGWAANRFGDPTPELEGRITLNPVAHLDLFGSLLIPLFLAIAGLHIFGWAKPVMVNPRNFEPPIRRKLALVALAGPLSNFFTAFLSAIALRLLFLYDPMLKFPFLGRGLFTSSIPGALTFIFFQLFVINAVLGLFNLFPIPPLDGGNVVSGLLPPKAAFTFDKIRPFGFLILLLLLYTRILDLYLNPMRRLFFLLLG